jgi:hypothetical protein
MLAYLILWYAEDYAQQCGLSHPGLPHYQDPEAAALLGEEAFVRITILRLNDWPA